MKLDESVIKKIVTMSRLNMWEELENLELVFKSGDYTQSVLVEQQTFAEMMNENKLGDD